MSKAARKRLMECSFRTLFVCNHSGGKDSQAMFKWMYENLPHEHLIVIHAELPGADWEGTLEHIQKTCYEIPVYVVKANKTFFEMVEHRGMWPSPAFRQCTSDLKTAPISKFIRKFCKEHHYDRVYNCIGLRAEESDPRALKDPFRVDKKLTTKKRKVYTVLPIHDYTTADVFASYGITLEDLANRRRLYQLGNKYKAIMAWPFIYTYVAGMSRHSCKICIMSKKGDLLCSAREDPEHFKRYVNIEKEIDHEFINPGHSTPSLSTILRESQSKQLQLL
ncbi:MAG: phosphoadenosine phosphosulfate reductase family protein [Cyclobacteriaceae bacterium]|jgi:DNA sulfur modification protein DndC|tara:strand:- start:158 stop:991 length:834 start_codon:yes stop_codon:yes gene_type:complete